MPKLIDLEHFVRKSLEDAIDTANLCYREDQQRAKWAMIEDKFTRSVESYMGWLPCAASPEQKT